MAGTCRNSFASKNTILVINSRRIYGLTDDNDAISYEYKDDIGELVEGLGGSFQANVSGSRLAQVKVKIFASHADRSFIDDIFAGYRELTDCSPVSAVVLNTGNGEGGSSSQGMPMKDGAKTFGTGNKGVREYTFLFANWDTDPVSFG